jgi:hypothetical protein
MTKLLITNLDAFAKTGIDAMSVSGQGSGLTLSEIKGFVSRGNLDVGLASAIATRLSEKPIKIFTMEPFAVGIQAKGRLNRVTASHSHASGPGR